MVKPGPVEEMPSGYYFRRLRPWRPRTCRMRTCAAWDSGCATVGFDILVGAIFPAPRILVSPLGTELNRLSHLSLDRSMYTL
jgi:hypothetical protein